MVGPLAHGEGKHMNFYESWLANNERIEDLLGRSPVVARGSELRWIETAHDARVAMLIGEAVGFPTQGTSLLKAEIPVGWHTGKRRASEEAVHIVQGTGFSVIDGVRYDWKPNTTLHVPYRSEHQHVNTGADTAVYVSASAIDLDFFVKLGRLIQLTEKGPNTEAFLKDCPVPGSQFAADGRRIALHFEDAIDENALRDAQLKSHPHQKHAEGTQAHRHAGIYTLMGGSEAESNETNGFRARAASMTNIFEETAHSSSHKHSHTEAMLYVLEGRGFSEVDGRRYQWEAGDAAHIPPTMTMHEHFNDSDGRTRTLRIEFGIRYVYEALWDGYQKIEHRPERLER